MYGETMSTTTVRSSTTASGLALDLQPHLLDREFGKGRVARFEDVDFPATLTHEPTRRFLRDTGLPEDGSLFRLDSDVPLPTLIEYYAEERPGEFAPARLPDRAHHLIRLGHLAEGNSLVVDGTTGTVLTWSEPEATLHPLATDISTFTYTLYLLHHDRTAAPTPQTPKVQHHFRGTTLPFRPVETVEAVAGTTRPAH
jgi:hypothetical protein